MLKTTSFCSADVCRSKTDSSLEAGRVSRKGCFRFEAEWCSMLTLAIDMRLRGGKPIKQTPRCMPLSARLNLRYFSQSTYRRPSGSSGGCPCSSVSIRFQGLSFSASLDCFSMRLTRPPRHRQQRFSCTTGTAKCQPNVASQRFCRRMCRCIARAE